MDDTESIHRLENRLAQIEATLARIDEILRGDGERTGLVGRVSDQEAVIGGIKRLTWVVAIGMLSVVGGFAVSILREYLSTRGGGP